MRRCQSLLTGFCTALITAAILPGQTPPSAALPSCVKSLQLPTQGLFAARAGVSGNVRALVQIGKNGQVGKVDLTGPNRILQAEVQVAMSLSEFESGCEGESLEFIFIFTLQDPPTDNILPPAVRFVPPNKFELTFRRVKPNVDAFGKVGQ
jgi:hypothetical protein